MGTNFYLRKNISTEKKNELHSYIDNEDWYSLQKHIPTEIHIGKKSAGWKFLWNANKFKYFKPNKESIMEFLQSGQIVDEYGEKISFDQFINKKIVDSPGNNWDVEAYYKEYPDMDYRCYYENHNRVFEEFPEIVPNRYGEFYIDGLRFTVSDWFE